MSRARSGTAGLLAAVAALATTELVAGLLPGVGSVFVAVGDAVIALTPGAVVRFAISTFGEHNRAVLLGSMAVGASLAGVAVGIGAARRRVLGVVGVAAFGALGAAAALTDPLVPTTTAVIAPLLGAVVGLVVLRTLLELSGSETASSRPAAPDRPASEASGLGTAVAGAAPPAAGRASRRRFLGVAGTFAVGATALAAGGRWLQTNPSAPPSDGAGSIALPRPSSPLPPPASATMLDVAGISPLITPNPDFFRIDTAFVVPQVAAETHRLRITGLVDHPFELGYAELLELADTEVDVTLSCVSNEVGGLLVGTARWFGVRLEDLLQRAGVRGDATQVVGRSVDGWTSGFPIEAVRDGRPALVAIGMNGEPLPEAHGFPARLVVAGLYGYVSNTKWLEEIELTTFEAHQAYWIPRGWSARGPIKLQSRIDVPRSRGEVEAGTVAVAGVAWSDHTGLSAVEVAVDDGPWERAELSAELAASAWRQWHLPWEATPGSHRLRVRAFDAQGEPQTAESSPPAPDGATGHHTIQITVV